MKRGVYFFVVLTLSLSLIFIFASEVSAAAIGIGRPFGGRVLSIVPCPCSGNSVLIIGPPKGGRFVIDFGTRRYLNYAPVPGRWVLGLADAYAPCLQFILVGCAPIPGIEGGSRIRMIGTS